MPRVKFQNKVNSVRGFLKRYIFFYFNSDCDKTIRTPSARITSPGFPGHYPNDVECVTRLRSDVISTLLVRFLSFTLEGGYDCDSDSVKIYPGIADFHL